jgi:hypothetical protein
MKVRANREKNSDIQGKDVNRASCDYVVGCIRVSSVVWLAHATRRPLVQNELQALQSRIKLLERRAACLTVGCVVLLACLAIIIQRVTVRVERVVISAPLPDPLEPGKRCKREGAISGILISDPKGNERAAYAASDTETLGTLLTLDSEDGQVFTVYANAKGTDGATVSLNSGQHDEIVLTTYERPRLQIVQNRKIVQKIPAAAEASLRSCVAPTTLAMVLH